MTQSKAIRIHELGGPEVLSWEDVDIPQAGPGEVVVANKAAGLNFIDIYFRTGLYPASLPFIPGQEGAGEITEIGDGVEEFAIGDRVAYLGGGAYATHTKVAATSLIRLPGDVSEEMAVAVLLKGLTAWMLLFEIRHMQPGESALVWAAAGGVGSIIVPWATSMGARVIGVCSTDAKAKRVLAAGASDVVRTSEDVAARVRELTGGVGVDVSYDSVGKDSSDASLSSLKPRGWWITFGNASGAVEPLPPARLAQGGSLIMTRPVLFSFIADAESLRRGSAAVFGALKTGTIKADIGQTFALEDVAAAHKALEARETVGSTVLTLV